MHSRPPVVHKLGGGGGGTVPYTSCIKIIVKPLVIDCYLFCFVPPFCCLCSYTIFSLHHAFAMLYVTSYSLVVVVWACLLDATGISLFSGGISHFPFNKQIKIQCYGIFAVVPFSLAKNSIPVHEWVLTLPGQYWP